MDFTKITSFKKACKVTGDNPLDKKYTAGTKRGNALEKMITCIKAINGKWESNYKNSSASKFEIIWKFDEKSGQFVCGNFYCWREHAVVGSHLVFENTNKSRHFGTTRKFVKLYNEFAL